MKQELEQATTAKKTVNRMFRKLGIDGEYIYNPTAKLIARNAFKAGAEWQKEQNELTWQDVKEIVNIADMLIVSNEPSKFPSEQRFYEGVLNEFNNLKNKDL